MDDETVRIVDFDWADTEGTATYPPEINISHNLEKRYKHDTNLVDLICN